MSDIFKDFGRELTEEEINELNEQLRKVEQEADGRVLDALQDKDAIAELHKLWEDTVNKTIQICEKYGLDKVDIIDIHADGLTGSYGHSQWTPYTDSSIAIFDANKKCLWDAM